MSEYRFETPVMDHACTRTVERTDFDPAHKPGTRGTALQLHTAIRAIEQLGGDVPMSRREDWAWLKTEMERLARFDAVAPAGAPSAHAERLARLDAVGIIVPAEKRTSEAYVAGMYEWNAERGSSMPPHAPMRNPHRARMSRRRWTSATAPGGSALTRPTSRP